MKRAAEGAADGEPSARASRLGAGKWALSDASGELEADYETLGVLGRGNFSEINLMRHRRTRELYALKTCAKLDAPSYSHLRAEARMMSDVRDPFLCTPLRISDPPSRAANFSILLPLCPGGDLLQLLRRQPNGALSEADARSYGAMVVCGLRALHAAGLVYRDLKPDNLLIQPNGYVALADFGFTARAESCGRCRQGTAVYLAPELLRKAAHGAPVDWWAFGALILEMITGSPPFVNEDENDDDEKKIHKRILAHAGGVPPLPPLGASGEGGAVGGAAPLSATASDLISGLLEPNVDSRLGADGVASHAWFGSVEWEGVRAMRTPAPHVPAPLDAEDVDATLLELTQRCQSGFD